MPRYGAAMSLQSDAEAEIPVNLLPETRDRICEKIHSMRGMSVQIADVCGIHPSSVYQWKKVPPQWVQIVAELIGMEPEQIRPDIFKKKKHPRPRKR